MLCFTLHVLRLNPLMLCFNSLIRLQAAGLSWMSWMSWLDQRAIQSGITEVMSARAQFIARDKIMSTMSRPPPRTLHPHPPLTGPGQGAASA